MCPFRYHIFVWLVQTYLIKVREIPVLISGTYIVIGYYSTFFKKFTLMFYNSKYFVPCDLCFVSKGTFDDIILPPVTAFVAEFKIEHQITDQFSKGMMVIFRGSCLLTRLSGRMRHTESVSLEASTLTRPSK